MKDFKIKNGTLLKYHGADTEVTIPDSVTSIGMYTFYDSHNLKSVKIPNGVTRIGNSAFYGCTSLANIIIPDSVTSIGDCAFYRCTSLKNVVIPQGVTSIGYKAFYGCKSLEGITIPESVKSIGIRAFMCCKSLKSITIPKNVKSIGFGAFYGCESLTSINIPDSVTSIGSGAFYYCYNLKTYKDRYFKATNGDMQCNGFQYELGKTYKTDKAQLCKCGFHACKSPLDVFNYYYDELGKDIRLFEVNLKGVTDENNDDSKCVGTEITFLKELTISELAKLASKNEGELENERL